MKLGEFEKILKEEIIGRGRMWIFDRKGPDVSNL